MNEDFIKRDYINPDLELNEEEGEIVCPDCNGWGVKFYLDENIVSTCRHCCGAGKMDWVDNLRGGLIIPNLDSYAGTHKFPQNNSGKVFMPPRFKKATVEKSKTDKNIFDL